MTSSYRFGPFLVDRHAYRVVRDGETVAISPKHLDLLLHLLDHAGDLVTKEALLDAIWPDANVTDNALTQAVSELRQAVFTWFRRPPIDSQPSSSPAAARVFPRA